jgi:hypothetical protein
MLNIHLEKNCNNGTSGLRGKQMPMNIDSSGSAQYKANRKCLKWGRRTRNMYGTQKYEV